MKVLKTSLTVTVREMSGTGVYVSYVKFERVLENVTR